jgi:tRNA-modifying protein YgfZ
MLIPQSTQAFELAELGVLRVRGPDAVRFLQGQLSQDMTRLTSGAQLAGLHNPQGRVLAVLRLVQTEPHEILAVLPQELLTGVIERLQRFVLRAKVSLSDASALWCVRGIATGTPDELARALESGASQAATRDIGLLVDATRALLLSARAGTAAQPLTQGAELWRRRDIAAGLPQVYRATTEAFVGQMLNLDLVGAVSFDKGCYTGQEVIARAHYRGRVKRRMQRFRSRARVTLRAGERRALPDGRTLVVIEASELADGRAEFLAVAPLAPNAGTAEPEEPSPQGSAALEADPLPLPYPVE